MTTSAKTKILNYLSKTEGYNTLTVAQARARFGITNVSARIDELRQEGHVIYTNQSNGSYRIEQRLQPDCLIWCEPVWENIERCFSLFLFMEK